MKSLRDWAGSPRGPGQTDWAPPLTPYSHHDQPPFGNGESYNPEPLPLAQSSPQSSSSSFDSPSSTAV
ncbi:hypothetical protein PCASD_13576 [Puccinia coronata f. sp. avenae]|uniref:Uncharacterized protein n=1 Tax=Puccinia coronata f. sp. avenae TaxID=200324 RepID=A0A2N5TDU5_9BASI|nr:hypothetical protein PCASD_13576 [Puccinia coronata f. sp. avenae]